EADHAVDDRDPLGPGELALRLHCMRSTTPVANTSSPAISRVIAGSGRGGGPATLRPVASSKMPSWHGQRRMPRSGSGITAHDRCVHFWLYASNDPSRIRIRRQGSCSVGYANIIAVPGASAEAAAIRTRAGGGSRWRTRLFAAIHAWPATNAPLVSTRNFAK